MSHVQAKTMTYTAQKTCISRKLPCFNSIGVDLPWSIFESIRLGASVNDTMAIRLKSTRQAMLQRSLFYRKFKKSGPFVETRLLDQ